MSRDDSVTGVRVDRRTFLAVTGTAVGGLVLGVYVLKRSRRRTSRLADGRSGTLTPFITIQPDNTVEIFAPRPEPGEGTLTVLPMLVAEELDADWDRVVVRQAENDPEAYGDQGVGGSDSVMSGFTSLRQAGALGRWLIVGAAADRWRVSPQQCRTEKSQVVNLETGATLSYGELAAAAALRALPAEPPALKDPATFQLLGTGRSGVGNRDIVRGRATYGLDVRFPGMLYAVVEKCPVFGGRVRSVMDADARAVRGVRDVVRIEGAPRHIWLRPGVAVIADSTWAAMQGRAALRVTWDEGLGATENSSAIRGRLLAASLREGKILRRLGDPERALAQATAVVDASYELPFLPHLTMEPMNCAAHVHDGRCEIWGPMQLPERAREVVAAVIGMPKAAIHVRMSRLGGGFGRRLLSDYAAEAAYLSKTAGAPVQVVWTREDDIRHDYYRAAAIHRVRAGVDAGGHVTAWDQHAVGLPNDAYPGEASVDGLLAPRGPDARRDESDGLTPCLIPNYVLRATTEHSSVQTGSLRAPSANVNAFVVQSMFDELAHAAHVDPVELRLLVLGDRSDFPYSGRRGLASYDPSRLKAVLRLAAQRANWATPLPRGRARGIAAHFTFSSYAAHVVEVSVNAENRLTIHRVVSAVDCGFVVNPSGAEAQVQGAVIDGLSAALFGEIHIEGGKTVESNFDSCRLLRISEVPPVEVHFVTSESPPTGLGEIPYPPVAPALTNAIFAATGKRIRRLPVVANGLTV